jgi:hypothetical protein
MVVIFRSPLKKKTAITGEVGFMLSAVAAAIHIELQPTARDQKLTQEMVEKERRLDEIYIL